jgi:hypothetical protein
MNAMLKDTTITASKRLVDNQVREQYQEKQKNEIFFFSRF